ncbi:MAG: insulinase family protein [Clostridium sp.]|nr:insulinase family protein [Clostridium sp.]
MKKLLTLTAAVLLSVTQIGAALRPIPADTAVRTGTLPNGLTYYIRHNAQPANRADFYIAQRVGSVNEEENQRGLAHFLEHMCFNGTRNFPGNSLIDYLESVGVKFGNNLNAYTSTDETVYNINEVPTGRFSTVDTCVMILSDWSHGLTLDPGEIDKERGVVKGEWRQRNGAAQTRLLERAAPLIYPGSLYGERLPIGLMEVVENFPYKSLRDFYDRWYWPVNQAVIIVGDIDPAAVEESVKHHFADIPAAGPAARTAPVDVPDNEEIISAVLSDPEQATAVAMIMVKYDGLSDEEAATIEDLRFGYTSALLTTMLNERLTAVRDSASAPFTSAFARDDDYMLSRSKRALTLRAFPKEGQTEQAVAVLTRELKRAAAQGFTPGEFERAKLSVGAIIDDDFVNRDRRTNTEYARRYVDHFLNGGTMASDEMQYQMLKGVRHTTTLDRVNSTLASIVRPDNRNVVILCYLPESEKESDGELLASVYRSTDGAAIPAFVDNAVGGPLLATEPAPGKILSEEALGQFGAQTWTLSNGIRVVLRPNDKDGDRVTVSAWSPGGFAANYDPAKAPSYKLFNNVIAAGGFGEYSASDLKKLMVGKTVSTGIAVENMEEELQAVSSSADMVDAFRLLYLKSTAPRRDSTAYEALLESNRMRLANSQKNAGHAMGDTIHAFVFNHHPLVEKVQLDELPRVSYDDIMAIHADRFGDMSDFTFIVVGNFNEDSLRYAVEHYVASLPGGGRLDEPKDIGYRYPRGRADHRFTFPMEVEQAMTYSFYHSPCDYTLSNVLHARILGEILETRLLEEIREKRGWTYGVLTHGGINGSINAGDPSDFLLPVNIRVSDGNEEECCRIVEETIADLGARPVGSEELLKVREYMLKSYRDSQDKNSYWQSMLKNWLEHSQDMHSTYEAALEAITPESLRQFAATHLDETNRLRLLMLPEKK